MHWVHLSASAAIELPDTPVLGLSPLVLELTLVADRSAHAASASRSHGAQRRSRKARYSIAVQRSITTERPPDAAIVAASQFTIPSCSHRQPAPMATASRAWGTHSSGRRK